MLAIDVRLGIFSMSHFYFLHSALYQVYRLVRRVDGMEVDTGGFSAIQQHSTDKNNMGGLFIRKLAGAAAFGVHAQKIIPLVAHPTGAQWAMGHYRPLLATALVGNMALFAFYASYLADLVSGGAGTMTGIPCLASNRRLPWHTEMLSSKRGPPLSCPLKTPSLSRAASYRELSCVRHCQPCVRDLLLPLFL
jgi:hypothetical protein